LFKVLCFELGLQTRVYSKAGLLFDKEVNYIKCEQSFFGTGYLPEQRLISTTGTINSMGKKSSQSLKLKREYTKLNFD
jgi:hypothetical protein